MTDQRDVERARAVAERIYACDPDHFPDDFLSYAPDFIARVIEETRAEAERKPK